MIRQYNRSELLLGISSVLAGAFGYGCVYLFFRHAPEYVLAKFGIRGPDSWFVACSLVVLVLISASGYRLWKRRGGFCSYLESGLYHELDLSSGGACAADHYAHQVTAPAYLLSQLFLSGPLMTLRGIARFKNRIDPDPSVEHRLEQTLAMLRSINKWQSLSEHPGNEDAILLLAKMGRIDFSTARGPRFKAYPADFHEREASND